MTVRSAFGIVLLFGVWLVAVPAHAALNAWTQLGPEGSTSDAIAVDPSNPNIVYAGTGLGGGYSGGVYKSVDGGATWTSRSVGLVDFSIHGLVVDPTSSNVVYASSEHGNLYKSTDGALTWTALATNACATYGFAIHPSAPATVYAVCAGVSKSTDGGLTWTSASLGLVSGGKGRIVIDPLTPSTLYASVYEGGVFKSTDAGVTWSEHDSGITNLRVEQIAIDPVTPSTLYAATQGAGVFKSVDGAASWTAVNNGLGVSSITAFGLAATSPNTLYAGHATHLLFKSIDGGSNWSAVSNALPAGASELLALAVDPSNAGVVYIGAAFAGLFRTTNGGSTWAPSTAGFHATALRAVAVDPFTPTTLYAGGQTLEGGVARSTDAGATWTIPPVNVSGLVQVIVPDPINSGTLYAGTNSGAFKTTDGGTTWSAINGGLVDLHISGLAVDPVTPTTLYAATDVGVSKTTNATTWSTAGVGLPSAVARAVAVVPNTPATLYAGFAGQGVYKSTDGGATWFAVNNGVHLGVSTLAIDPVSSAVYAGTGGGTYKSTDGGTNWLSVANGIPGDSFDVRALLIDPAEPSIVYQGSSGGGVHRSHDGGASWLPFSDGLAARDIRALALDPTDHQRLYLASAGGGVATALLRCDDGSVDAGEQCDEGATTGGPASCCTFPSCQFKSAGIVCRAAAGVCDQQEVCAGTQGSCGSDAKSSAVCRPAVDACDAAESCDGIGDDCPSDQLRAAGAVCRPSAGICDLAETCTGASTSCPGDAKSSAICRSAAGVCDGAEACDGVADVCPADGMLSVGTVCRAAAGVCDVAEACTGASAACPVDAKSTAVCRAAAGGCDVAESCDGVSNPCPSNAVAGNGTVCRAAAGFCDVTEVCDGTGASCPSDAKSAAVCRPAANACDVAESCDGASNACPGDDIGNGHPCDDASACTAGDQCSAGSCVGGPPTDCNDGNPCTDDSCSPGSGCGHTPNSASCDDGLYCTVSDACSGGSCGAGSARDCTAAADQCNAGTCDELHDQCAPMPVANGNGCSDSLACTVGDACVGGQCVGLPMTCGDAQVDVGCAERCDDGGSVPDDGCDAACNVEPGWSCTGSPSVCARICGDGAPDSGEMCDDTNLAGGDGCSNTCALESGWQCPNPGDPCIAVCGDGLVRGHEQCDDGDLADGNGCESDCTITPKIVGATASPGGTVRTDVESDGVSVLDPVEAAVTTPTGGAVTIRREPATSGAPAGFSLLGQQFVITAPPGTAAEPLVFEFVLDGSLDPTVALGTVPVQRNGANVANCTGPSGEASPDPCVAGRTLLANGEDLEIVVLTSAASTWTFAADICGVAPRTDCRRPVVAAKAQLQLKDSALVGKDTFQWKWQKGAVTLLGDLGDPLTSTAYTLCVYDAGAPRARLAVPAGGTCAGRQCWTAKSGGYVYGDKALHAAGVQALQLKASTTAGKPKIQLKASGSALPMPALPFSGPVVVQLTNSTTNACWEAIYSAPFATNTAAQFKDKSD